MQLSAHDCYLLGQCAISAAFQAGQIIVNYTQRTITVKTKNGGGSLASQVVTEVDHLSQDVILRILQPSCAMFDLALLTEESADDGERLSKDFFWCIDPLDGTLPFIESVPGYSVSIALVACDGTPIIGVVYDPFTQTLYHAITGQGARLNQKDLKALPLSPSEQQILTFITDKSFADDPLYEVTRVELDHIATDLGYSGVKLTLQGGAAMNACQVLASPPACYFKFPKPQVGGGSIWDYAATSCLFNEANALVSDMYGNPLVLNPDGPTFMNHCGILYCADPMLSERMVRLYQHLNDNV